MSRSTATAFDTRPSNVPSTADADASGERPCWSEDKNPTRPLPVFRLEEEARRLDRAAAMAAMRCDDDAMGYANSDDEPTLEAPAPSSPEAIAAMSSPLPVRVTARPPALKALVITRPAPTPAPRAAVSPAAVIPRLPTEPLELACSTPSLAMSMWEPWEPAAAPPSSRPAVVGPPSGSHGTAPERAQAADDLRDIEDGRRSEPTVTSRLRKPPVQTYLVAGIWALALSLLAVLMFMAMSA